MGGGRVAALVAEISRYVYQGRRRVGELISPRRRQTRIATITVGALALLLVAIVAAIAPDGEDPGAGQGLALPTEQPPPAEATAAEGLGSATPGEPGTTAPATPSRTPSKSTSGPVVPPPPRTSAAGPTTTYYEAENALLIGAAEVSNMPEASAGKIVHELGTDAYGRSGQISFTQVTVPIATRYALTVCYVSGENRNAHLSVNNGPAYQLGFPSNGGWDRVGRQTFTISLNAGRNSLTFSNPYGWAPRLDRISILG